jgi:hypothetical protein
MFSKRIVPLGFLAFFICLQSANAQYEILRTYRAGNPDSDSRTPTSAYRTKDPKKTLLQVSSDLTVLSIRGASLPPQLFYVVKGSDLYQVWKEGSEWKTADGSCRLITRDDIITFQIVWESGSKEVGEFADGVYTIKSHSTDQSQVNGRYEMKLASLPADARRAVHGALQRSVQSASSVDDLRIANDWLDIAERHHKVKTRRASNRDELIRRMAFIREQADLEIALDWLDTMD